MEQITYDFSLKNQEAEVISLKDWKLDSSDEAMYTNSRLYSSAEEKLEKILIVNIRVDGSLWVRRWYHTHVPESFIPEFMCLSKRFPEGILLGLIKINTSVNYIQIYHDDTWNVYQRRSSIYVKPALKS